MIKDIKKQIENQQKKILTDFYTFLRFPSISSEREYKQDVLNCAEWLVDQLETIGFEVEQWPTTGHPVIFATHLKAGSDKPTLLLYNHYDVQPIDPIEEWFSPPFSPIDRNGEVFARGAQDNKGQCFYVLQALRLFLETNHEFPINIKWCIEGEEEMGSPGLSLILNSKEKELKSDYLAIVDVGTPDSRTPSVTLGTRGLIAMDIELQCSSSDMHSGTHGGIALNPIHALIKLLSELRDSSGYITIPGFYDSVIKLSPEEMNLFSNDFDEEKYRNEMGCEPIGGEISFSPLKRNWFRPTFEINGIWGGYTGKGFKTVIPAKAFAKISCRLVPDQDPVTMSNLISKYLKSKTPKGAILTVNVHSGHGEAMRVNPNSKVVKAFVNAFETVFNAPCKYILSGASIPIVVELAKASKAETVLVGLGLSTDNIHAPNEHFGVNRLKKGIEVIMLAIQNLRL
jgi:acetylornithine deacetylase/succinyl-diaminopimelate desuccinylase-like protein